MRAWTAAGSSLSNSQVPAVKCSADGEGGEHGLAARHLDDAHLGGLHGVGVGDVAAVEVDRAADGVDEARRWP